eukprot:GFUD01035399.1.p1 GENE.GFUD01035399.1~~GFUD01035399.1.p1  ORF type:complete len:311 (+),score=88.00 GFUD01035399.1:108-1040(+)
MFSELQPISVCELKRLDRVRSLLEQLGPSEKDSAVEFLFGSKDDLKSEKDVFAEEDDDKMEVEVEEYEQPPEKKIKVEINEKLNISTLLEGCTDLTDIWAQINQDPQNISSEALSEKALENLMKIISTVEIEDKQALEYFIAVMTKTMLHLKIYQKSYEDFYESFLVIYPNSCHQIASQLVIEPALCGLVLFLINLDLMTEDQEKSVLLRWLAEFSIESSTLELPEVILSRNTKLYEDNQVVGALSSSFASGVAEGSDKCVKFAKFLLQVLSKVADLEERVVKNFKLVTERNRTFLRKKLETEVDKKSAS